MSNRASKITELTSIGTTNTAISSGDLFIVENLSANATRSVALSTLRKAIVQGPYLDSTAAGVAGVLLGQLYYISDGTVKVKVS